MQNKSAVKHHCMVENRKKLQNKTNVTLTALNKQLIKA